MGFSVGLTESKVNVTPETQEKSLGFISRNPWNDSHVVSANSICSPVTNALLLMKNTQPSMAAKIKSPISIILFPLTCVVGECTILNRLEQGESRWPKNKQPRHHL